MTTMSITIEEPAIKQAIIQHVNTMGVNTDGKEVTILLKAGRGTNGYTATIDISESITKDVISTSENVVSNSEDDTALSAPDLS